ncbi:hypothetical protein SLA2020_067800 [Shorea laevis]
MNSSSFGAMGTPFEPEGKLTNDELGPGSIEELSLYDLLQKDVPLGSPAWDTFLNSVLESQMVTGNLAGSSNVASTGGEPHHDHHGMQGETTAAAQSSGGRTTQSSPHNENF